MELTLKLGIQRTISFYLLKDKRTISHQQLNHIIENNKICHQNIPNTNKICKKIFNLITITISNKDKEV